MPTSRRFAASSSRRRGCRRTPGGRGTARTGAIGMLQDAEAARSRLARPRIDFLHRAATQQYGATGVMIVGALLFGHAPVVMAVMAGNPAIVACRDRKRTRLNSRHYSANRM